jgi:hypothetical protein
LLQQRAGSGKVEVDLAAGVLRFKALGNVLEGIGEAGGG